MPIDADDPADGPATEPTDLDVDDELADEVDEPIDDGGGGSLADVPDEVDPDAVALDLNELEDGEPADSDAAMIARAKKKYGIGGAMLAGGMLGLDRMLTGKVKQDAPIEYEAPGEPLDIDRKGITVPLEDERVVRSKPGPAAAPGAISRRVTRRRRP